MIVCAPTIHKNTSICHNTHMQVRGQLSRSQFLLYGFCGSDSDHQAWRSAPLPTEPSLWPLGSSHYSLARCLLHGRSSDMLLALQLPMTILPPPSRSLLPGSLAGTPPPPPSGTAGPCKIGLYHGLLCTCWGYRSGSLPLLLFHLLFFNRGAWAQCLLLDSPRHG